MSGDLCEASKQRFAYSMIYLPLSLRHSAAEATHLDASSTGVGRTPISMYLRSVRMGCGALGCGLPSSKAYRQPQIGRIAWLIAKRDASVIYLMC